MNLATLEIFGAHPAYGHNVWLSTTATGVLYPT